MLIALFCCRGSEPTDGLANGMTTPSTPRGLFDQPVYRADARPSLSEENA